MPVDDEGIEVTNTPDKPVQAQVRQEIVLAEINEAASTKVGIDGGNSVKRLFDKNVTLVYNSIVGPTHVAHIVFNSPILIGRITVVSTGAAPTITVYDKDNVATVVVNDTNFAAFISAMAVDVVIGAPPATISEVIILKVIEVKATIIVPPIVITSTPAEPLFTQDAGQVVVGEIDLVNSDLDTSLLFDKNTTTGVAIVGPGSHIVVLQFPILINRIVIVGMAPDFLDTCTVQANRPDGSSFYPILNQSGWSADSGPITPEYIVSFSINCVGNSDVAEVIMQKVHGDNVASVPGLPTFTQDEGVVCHDEIYWNNVVAVGLLTPADTVEYPFSKNPAVTWLIIGAFGFVDYYFNNPKLIDRIVVQGNFFSADTTIQMIGLDGVTPISTVTVPIGSNGYDSGKITPVAITGLFIIAGTGSAQIININLYKVHDVAPQADISINQLYAQIKLIVDALARVCLAIDPSTSRVNAQVAGSLTTVTTVTTVTGMTNMGGQPILNTLLNWSEDTDWALVVRGRIA